MGVTKDYVVCQRREDSLAADLYGNLQERYLSRSARHKMWVMMPFSASIMTKDGATLAAINNFDGSGEYEYGIRTLTRTPDGLVVLGDFQRVVPTLAQATCSDTLPQVKALPSQTGDSQ